MRRFYRCLCLSLRVIKKYSDAAQELGIPVGTVKSRLHNAIVQLFQDGNLELQQFMPETTPLQKVA